MATDFITDAKTTIGTPWRHKTTLQKSYTVACALLVIAILPMPYGYYASMRLGICVCLYFYYISAKGRTDLNPRWTYAIVGMGVLYNPVIPIHLGTQIIWTVINAATVFFLYRAKLAIECSRDDATPSTTGVRSGTEPAADTDWVRPFVLYYVASEMASVPEGDMPLTVQELALDQPSDATTQSLLVQLRNYLSFAYERDPTPDDLRKAITEAPIVLRAEIQTGNSILALKRFIRRLHTNPDGTSDPEHEIEAAVIDASEQIRSDSEMAGKLRTLILKDSVEQLFEASYNMPIQSYIKKMQDHYGVTA